MEIYHNNRHIYQVKRLNFAFRAVDNRILPVYNIIHACAEWWDGAFIESTMRFSCTRADRQVDVIPKEDKNTIALLPIK